MVWVCLIREHNASDSFYFCRGVEPVWSDAVRCSKVVRKTLELSVISCPPPLLRLCGSCWTVSAVSTVLAYTQRPLQSLLCRVWPLTSFTTRGYFYINPQNTVVLDLPECSFLSFSVEPLYILL